MPLPTTHCSPEEINFFKREGYLIKKRRARSRTDGARPRAQWPVKTYQYEKANNLFLGRNPQQQLQDVGSLKFWLTPGADVIDSGKPITGFTDSFLGEAPDLGAYESGGARWLPGVRGRAEHGAEEDKHAEA